MKLGCHDKNVEFIDENFDRAFSTRSLHHIGPSNPRPDKNEITWSSLTSGIKLRRKSACWSPQRHTSESEVDLACSRVWAELTLSWVLLLVLFQCRTVPHRPHLPYLSNPLLICDSEPDFDGGVRQLESLDSVTAACRGLQPL